MDKKINYLARTFDDIRGELVSFSKKYYPELTPSFNDASVGSWFLDLMAAVGDNLSYYTDRAYQTTNINSANSRKALLNLARINGVKVPGQKAAMCEVELSIILPVSSDKSGPDYTYAPIIRKASTVGNSSYKFEISEDVDFSKQFNEQGFSNRKYTPNRDSSGLIVSYTVTKTVLAISGESKIYKKVLMPDDVKPFMTVLIPELNVMEVESVIFKESSSLDDDPKSFEYKIEEEEFRLSGQTISTFRYFEVDSLSDQYRFAPESNWADDGKTCFTTADYFPYIGSTSDDNSHNYTKGVWKPISQKFITEYTDNGYMKLTFGSGTEYSPQIQGDDFSQYISSRIVNNMMLGILPKVGWTMYIRYRVGGGASANVGIGALDTVINANMVFPKLIENVNPTFKGNVIKSLKCTNKSVSVGGKDAPSNEELKYLIKYHASEQNRCVTLKDYKERVMMIPPRYGCPFRCSVLEDNNKIVLSYLGINANGTLSNSLPETVVDNMIEYISHYKNLGDYVVFKSGKIFNVGVMVDIFADKNYVTADVVKNVIATIKSYMDINNHDIGEDIFIGDLEKEINLIDGVVSLIDLRIYSLEGDVYSDQKCPLPKDNDDKFEQGSTNSLRIKLEDTDYVLVAEHDSMYEIKYEKDIKVRVKLK